MPPDLSMPIPTRLMSAVRSISAISPRVCAASSASPSDEAADIRMWGDGSTSP